MQSRPSSLSDLGVRSEGKSGLRQFLVSFEANSGSKSRQRNAAIKALSGSRRARR
jgi:hypothetical protein